MRMIESKRIELSLGTDGVRRVKKKSVTFCWTDRF
jgi:hypothetical protein